jgi:hypothetical protein
MVIQLFKSYGLAYKCFGFMGFEHGFSTVIFISKIDTI